MTSSRARSVGSSIALLLSAAACVLALHSFFDASGGPSSLLVHREQSDRMLGSGEVQLAFLLMLLGLPASVCLGAVLRRIPKSAFESLERVRWMGLRSYYLAPSFFAAAATAGLAHFVGEYSWYTDDEQGYFYLAKLLARGELTGAVLEPGAALQHVFVVLVKPGAELRWASVYPLLQPLLMSLGLKLGHAHLSQVLVVLFLVYNAGRLAERLLDSKRVGHIAAWLCAFSPLLLGLGSSYHNSVLTTLLSVSSVRLLLSVLDHFGAVRGVALGALTGAIVLARPLEGALMVLAVGVSLVFPSIWPSASGSSPHGSSRWRRLLAFGAGGLVPLCALALINLWTTGIWLAGPYSVLEREIGTFFGFGTHRMWSRTHDVLWGVRQTGCALVRVNNWFFGWPIGLLVVLGAAVGPLRARAFGGLVLLSLSQFAAYFFLAFGSVHDFGSAYHVWQLPWAAALVAWGIVRGDQLLEDHPRWSGWCSNLALAMTVVGLATFWPIQIERWRAVSGTILAPVRAAEKAAQGEAAIVRYHSFQPPTPIRTWVHYPPAPHPDDLLLWARDDRAFDEELARRFPERTMLWLSWEGDAPVVRVTPPP